MNDSAILNIYLNFLTKKIPIPTVANIAATVIPINVNETASAKLGMFSSS